MNDFKSNIKHHQQGENIETQNKPGRGGGGGGGGGQNIDFFTDLVNLVVMVGIDTNFWVVVVLIVNKYATYVWYKWYKQQEHI